MLFVFLKKVIKDGVERRGRRKMHSGIFQLSKKPIPRDEYLEESFFYDHWFTQAIADYVDGDTDRQCEMEWLTSQNAGISIGNDDAGDFLIIKDREKYFAKSQGLRKALKDVEKQISQEEFASASMAGPIWQLGNCYNEQFGLYVVLDGDVTTFDSFVRNADVGEKHYIGATLNYHV